MSDLLNTEEGRNALLLAQRYQLEHRLSRFFHRTVVIDFDRYEAGSQEFDLATTLGNLNKAHDNEILEIYRLLASIGGLSTTLADMTIYVNETTGSDVTGTGSAARPFASLWFVENLPRRINHKVRVVLMSDVDDGTRNIWLDFSFGAGGSFAIIGSGAPTVLQTNTVGAIGTLGGGGGSWIACVNPWLVDDGFLFSKNYAVPLHKIDTISGPANVTCQSHPFSIAGVTNGDPISMIAPSRTLRIHSLGGQCIGQNSVEFSQVGIFNLNITFTPSGGMYADNRCSNLKWNHRVNSTLSFVRFNAPWMIGGFVPANTIQDHKVNTYGFIDQTQVLTLANTGITNLDNLLNPFMGPTICGAKFLSGFDYRVGMYIRDCEISSLDFHCVVEAWGCFRYAYGNVGTMRTKNAKGELENCITSGYVSPGAPFTAGGVEMYNSSMRLSLCSTLISDNCICLVGGGNTVKIEMCGSDVGYSDINNAGLWVSGYNHIELWYNSPTSTPATELLVGTVGGDGAEFLESTGFPENYFVFPNIVDTWSSGVDPAHNQVFLMK